jgi:NAD(P)-dependent dehydrogenase (short-subunit alcohol dehydrogenase family)
MAFGLDGKIAIVTGPGGFGRGYALGLAGAGCRVVVADTEDSGPAICDDLRSAGHEALFVRTDVTSEESTRSRGAATTCGS